jgi:DegV family protein with EDD domain
MSLGLISIAAATVAKAGEGLQGVLEKAKQAIHNTHLLGLVDTLKYLLLGGRIGKAKALLGSVLNVKPMLAVRDGETVPVTQVRTRAKGIDRLFDFVKNASDIQDLAVTYSTTFDEAQTLAERLRFIFTKEPIKVARMGTTLGVHLGPGALIVALREGKADIRQTE